MSVQYGRKARHGKESGETVRLLDLYCCQGGATRGYQLAGFEVTGVDIMPQSRYCGTHFHQADALEFVRDNGAFILSYFDAISASPPCQGQIRITKANRKREGWTDDHVNLIPETRELLDDLGLPYVIENGPSEHIRPDITLCGLMFGLPILRDRSFEIGHWPVPVLPDHPTHRGHLTIGWRHGCRRTLEPSLCPKHERWCKGDVYGVYGKGGGKPSVAEAQRALGIDWVDRIEDLNEAIPPAYTQWIGGHLRSYLESAK